MQKLVIKPNINIQSQKMNTQDPYFHHKQMREQEAGIELQYTTPAKDQ